METLKTLKFFSVALFDPEMINLFLTRKNVQCLTALVSSDLIFISAPAENCSIRLSNNKLSPRTLELN
jgi:hypothetical protein